MILWRLSVKVADALCFYTDSYRAAGIEGEREAGSTGQLADVTSEPDPS